MTTTSTDVPSRFSTFAPGELAVLQTGTMRLADDIMEQARARRLPAPDAPNAAATLLAAVKLAYEIDDTLGADHPPLRSWESVASWIADGSYADLMEQATGIAQSASDGVEAVAA